MYRAYKSEVIKYDTVLQAIREVLILLLILLLILTSSPDIAFSF